jgi:hypothetical protein
MTMTASTNTALWRLRPELCRDVAWQPANEDETILCEALVAHELWQVRLNGVEAGSLYSLHIDSQPTLEFDDWPGFWRWPGAR